MKFREPVKEFVPGRGYSPADWDETDDAEVSPEQARQAQPFAKAFPDLAESARRTRGQQKAPAKTRVTLRLDRATVDAFKATGAGWQTRLDAALKLVAPGHPPPTRTLP